MIVPKSPEEFASTFDTEGLDWMHLTGTPRFDYPIEYWVAMLHVDEAAERIDFISRWAPNAYCHTHRHLGATTILVLEGEHHVVEKEELETVHKTRIPGFCTTNPGGDLHMEYGGDEGSLVYFSCQAVDGDVFDVVDDEGRVLRTATVEDFTSGQLGK